MSHYLSKGIKIINGIFIISLIGCGPSSEELGKKTGGEYCSCITDAKNDVEKLKQCTSFEDQVKEHKDDEDFMKNFESTSAACLNNIGVEIEKKIELKNLQGDLSKNISIDPNSIKLKVKEGNLGATMGYGPNYFIKFKTIVIKKFSKHISDEYKNWEGNVSFLDSDGNEISSQEIGYERGLEPLLKSGEGEVWLESYGVNIGSEINSIIKSLTDINKIATVNITMRYVNYEDKASDKVESTTDNGDWDKLLDDYEEYVDKYVILYKKAMAGDATAIAEYPGLLEKATELSESLQKAQDNNSLSSKHLVRMAKIQKKMLEAVSGK